MEEKAHLESNRESLGSIASTSTGCADSRVYRSRMRFFVLVSSEFIIHK